MKEDQEEEDQEVEEEVQGINPEIDTEIVDTEAHAVIEVDQQARIVDTKIGMITPAIGTAEGYAKRP